MSAPPSPGPGVPGLLPLARTGNRNSISVSDTDRIVLVHEFLRGAVRLHILHHAAREEIHGAWMANELAHHGYEISPGSLYPTLHKMEAEGLISSRSRVADGDRKSVVEGKSVHPGG